MVANSKNKRGADAIKQWDGLEDDFYEFVMVGSSCMMIVGSKFCDGTKPSGRFFNAFLEPPVS